MRLQASIMLVLLGAFGAAASSSSDPVRVVPEGAVDQPRQPQAAVDQQGNIFVAYGSGERIFCSVSTDGGRTYESPVLVGQIEKLALGKRRGPRIAAAGDNVVITASGHAQRDLLAWQSTDKGKTWQGPVTVNDVAGVTPEALHAMAAGPNGEFYCVWLDLRGKPQNIGQQIFGSVSTDGGRTWSSNQLIYRSPSGTVCECCHPAVTYDRQGQLHVMWRNSLDGKRDMFTSISRDGGRTFAPAVKLGTGSWRLDACPMDGGYLAVPEPGKLTTVWRREQQVFRTDSGSRGEQLLGVGEQPWAAATAEGAWLVWVTRNGGDLLVQTPGSEQPLKVAGGAADPVIAAPLLGDGPVVVVWESVSGNKTIMAAVVSD